VDDTRGPFGRLLKSLCDFGDMTPHTLVGGAQTTPSRQRPARARVVETAQVRPGDLEIKPIPALRRFGPARGGHRGHRYGPKVPDPIPIEWDQGGKGVNPRGTALPYTVSVSVELYKKESPPRHTAHRLERGSAYCKRVHIARDAHANDLYAVLSFYVRSTDYGVSCGSRGDRTERSANAHRCSIL
jgi:hypothetical protein